jgi:hypothetical protein
MDTGKDYGAVIYSCASVMEAKVLEDTADDPTVETYFLKKFMDFKGQGMRTYTGQRRGVARFYDTAASAFKRFGKVKN